MIEQISRSLGGLTSSPSDSAPSNPAGFQPASSSFEVAKPTLFSLPSEQDPGLEDIEFMTYESYFRLSQDA